MNTNKATQSSLENKISSLPTDRRSRSHNKLVLFDKVSLTYPVVEDKRENLRDLINTQQFKNEFGIKVGGYDSRYNNNYWFYVEGINKVWLSIYPINKEHNFFRLSFNPNSIGHEGVRFIRKILIKLLGLKNTKEFYFKAKVTRLDLTMDIYDFPRNLIPYKAGIKVSSIHRSNDGSTISSFILGSRKSDCQVTIYDKNIEQGIESDQHYVRTEIELRNLNCSLHELNSNLMYEFKKIRFFNDEFMTDPMFSADFISTVSDKDIGLSGALINLDRNQRNQYLRRLAHYEVCPLRARCKRFDYAHYDAFRPLVHPDFINTKLLKKHKSLLKGVVYPTAKAV